MNQVRVSKRSGRWVVTRVAYLMGVVPCRAAVYATSDYDDAPRWARECAGFYAALVDYGATPVIDR